MPNSSLVVFLAVLVFSQVACYRLPSLQNCVNKNRILRMHSSADNLRDTIKQKILGASTTALTGIGELAAFLNEYIESGIAAKTTEKTMEKNIQTLFTEVKTASVSPPAFGSFHQAIREPFDYYKWGNDFIKPLMIMEQSKLFGAEQINNIKDIVSRQENVVFLANHQTEADPQALSILLEKHGYGELAEKIIYLAGHKVTTDPFAIPFAKGRNLLCIHSKKHIHNPPEDLGRKQAQNMQTMEKLTELAAEGGKVFWVAPSGGRDRLNAALNKFTVSDFDGKVLDMFRMTAMRSQRPMHFFPMAMLTNTLVPPPASVSSSIGEARSAKRSAVSIHLLPETEGLGAFKDRVFLQELQQRVVDAYDKFCDWHNSLKSANVV